MLLLAIKGATVPQTMSWLLVIVGLALVVGGTFYEKRAESSHNCAVIALVVVGAILVGVALLNY